MRAFFGSHICAQYTNELRKQWWFFLFWVGKQKSLRFILDIPTVSICSSWVLFIKYLGDNCFGNFHHKSWIVSVFYPKCVVKIEWRTIEFLCPYQVLFLYPICNLNRWRKENDWRLKNNSRGSSSFIATKIQMTAQSYAISISQLNFSISFNQLWSIILKINLKYQNKIK